MYVFVVSDGGYGVVYIDVDLVVCFLYLVVNYFYVNFCFFVDSLQCVVWYQL